MTPRLVAGADGCPGGWIVVRDTGEAVSAELLADAAGLVALAQGVAALGVDIPIGLPDDGPRACDLAARAFLGAGRTSSVFPAPVRAALGAADYGDACARSLAACGKKLTLQTWHLVARIRDMDTALRADPGVAARIHEVHPESSFHLWSGQAGLPPKKTAAGRAARLTLVEARWPGAWAASRAACRKALVRDDDLLDAFAALWSAHRIAAGTALQLPAEVARDAHGLRMVIQA